MSRRLSAVVLAGGLLLGAAGCGGSEQPGGSSASEPAQPPGSASGSPAATGTETITPRAVAAIALEHLPADPSDVTSAPVRAGTAANIRYGSQFGGELVTVAVSPAAGGSPCESFPADGCVETEVSGGTQSLFWEEQAPGEDVGVVVVVVRRGDTDIAASYTGADISGDPRDLDLAVSVEEMEATVNDPDLAPLTSPAAIKAGEDLETWRES